MRMFMTKYDICHLKLPRPGRNDPLRETSLLDSFYKRRSDRELDPNGLLLIDEVADILFSADGVTCPAPPADDLGHPSKPRRTVPSPGAVYPLNVYLLASRVESLLPGAYLYETEHHSLLSCNTLAAKTDRPGVDTANAVKLAALATYPHKESKEEMKHGSQTWMEAASAIVLITGVPKKLREAGKGSPLTLEAGMVVQNALLACAASDISATPVAAFHKDGVMEAAGLDSGVGEEPIIMIALGQHTKRPDK